MGIDAAEGLEIGYFRLNPLAAAIRRFYCGAMTSNSTSLTLFSPEHTSALAENLGAHLRAGDTILLEGAIGVGKTHFARSLIQMMLPVVEDVPSPTFTLVQVYDAEQTEIWHADLYRLSSPDEVVELGLSDAFEDAVCLIEWPDRLADLAPAGALRMAFSLTPDERHRDLQLTWEDSKWNAIIQAITT